MTVLAILALGFFLGMRHATDADHVVAVAAIVSRERSRRGALSMGALWGIGHSATVFVVGTLIIGFGLVIPPRVGLSMEMSVAVMLVVLGAINVLGARHAIDQAAHPGPTDERPASRWMRYRFLRPLGIGFVHGMAGSAAVALLVLATIHDPAWAVLYLVVFGVGTVAGMVSLTAAMAVPLAAAARRGRATELLLARITGVASMGFGVLLAYRLTA